MEEEKSMRCLFGDLFDFDRDGELDSFERATELDYLDHQTRDREYRSYDYDEDDDLDFMDLDD